VADRVTVLRDGESVGMREVRARAVTVRSSQLLTESELIRMMVGRELSIIFPAAENTPGEPLLALEGVGCRASGIRDITLQVRAGEILGLAGLVGAGRTELARILFGITPADSGSITLAGELVEIRSPQDAVEAGIGYVPEDRRLISALSARENILVPAWAGGLPDAEARLDGVYTLMPELRELAARPAALLSGGQQKLVALARSFMYGSRLLLLDEPFEGVAPPLARRLVRAVREFQEHRPGLSVLVAESEVKWVRLLTDKIYSIERGTTAEVPAPAP